MTSQSTQGVRVNRAEWGVVFAIFVNLLTLAFMFGVIWTRLNQNTVDIAGLKTQADGQATQLARIDANVSFLADRAREDRETRRAISMADRARLQAEVDRANGR